MKNIFQRRIIIGLLIVLTLFSSQCINAQEPSLDKLVSISEDNIKNIGLIAEIEIANVEDLDWVDSIAINMTGDLLAVGQEKGELSLYDLLSLHRLVEFDDHTSSITSLEFSNIDNNILVSGSLDTTISIWNTHSLEKVLLPQNDYRGVLALSFHPSKDIVAFSRSANVFYPPNNTVNVWDLQTMEELAVLGGHEGQITALKYSPDGEILVFGDSTGTIFVWDADNYQQIAQVDTHGGLLIKDIAFNSDSTLFASVGYDGAINLWDDSNFELIKSDLQEEKRANTVSFANDSKMLAIGYSDGTVRILDDVSLKELASFQAHNYPISQLIFSPKNNSIITGSTDGNIRIWGIETNT